MTVMAQIEHLGTPDVPRLPAGFAETFDSVRRSRRVWRGSRRRAVLLDRRSSGGPRAG